MFLYDGTEVTVTYETAENAGGGGGCNVAGYMSVVLLALVLFIRKKKG